MLGSKKRHVEDGINSNILCILRSDTGNVICPSHVASNTHGIWKGQNYIPLDRRSKHVYLVPKRCVEWKTLYHTNRVYYKTLVFALKIQSTDDDILGNDLQIQQQHILISASGQFVTKHKPFYLNVYNIL